MAHGREAAEWARTAELLAMVYNAHRGPKTSALTGRDFNPHAEAAAPPPKVGIEILKTLFVGNPQARREQPRPHARPTT